jgi:flavin reductase (DIM6/NTAB) family NADH-FMN oxidoreductase RutF
MDIATTDAFKDAFRRHPAGIALITAMTPEGPVGLTASSVASVGLDPLALAFSVTRATGSAGGILRAQSFVVHLLSADDLPVAQTFAVSGTERFTAEQGWEYLPTGEPHLTTARVAMRCRPLQVIPVGASSLVLAEVLQVIEGPQGHPLVYQDRTFHVLRPPAV